jgi:general secretion pathway protein K
VEGFLPRPRRRGPEPPAGERGFVLIAAVWLLILAGAITAILMLRSLAAAAAAADHGDAIQRRLALESAIETVLADRLFNADRSAWWLAPSAGRVAIGGRMIDVRLTSESGRLDVNSADPALIDTALRGFGVGASERGRIVARLRALRLLKKRIGSLAELGSLVGGACLAGELTYVSGLAEPRPDQMSRELARALGGRGGAAGGGRPAAPEAGAAVRVEAAEGNAAPILAIVRITPLPDQPLSASAWAAPSPCASVGR